MTEFTELVMIDSNVDIPKYIAKKSEFEILEWCTGLDKCMPEILHTNPLFYNTPIGYSIVSLPWILKNFQKHNIKLHCILYIDYTKNLENLKRIQLNLAKLSPVILNIIEFTELPMDKSKDSSFGDYFVRRNNHNDASVGLVIAKVIDGIIKQNMVLYSVDDIMSGTYKQKLTNTDNEISIKRFLENVPDDGYEIGSCGYLNRMDSQSVISTSSSSSDSDDDAVGVYNNDCAKPACSRKKQKN